MAYVVFIVICVIWGSSFILMKLAGDVFGPLSVAGGRVAGGAVILLVVWVIVKKGRRWPIGWRDVPAIMVVVLLGCAWPFAVQPHLIIKYQDSAFFGMMVALVPLLTIVLSIPLLRVHPTARQLIGVGVGLVCLGALLGVGLLREITVSDLCLAASVPLAYATSNTFMKRRFQNHSPLAITLAALSLSSILLVPAGLAREPMALDRPELPAAIGALAVLGLLGSGLAWLMFFDLVQKRGPLFAGMVTYIVPIGAVVWGAVDGETISNGQIAALVGVFLCTALVQSGSAGPVKPALSAEKSAPDDPETV